MTPEQILRLADAEREFEHTTSNGWVLRCRVPTRIQMRAAVRAAGGSTDVACERLALAGVVGWRNVTGADVGLPASMAGVPAGEPVPCTPALVEALLADRLAVLDALQADFIDRINARVAALEADEKNSASV